MMNTSRAEQHVSFFSQEPVASTLNRELFLWDTSDLRTDDLMIVQEETAAALHYSYDPWDPCGEGEQILSLCFIFIP